MKNRKRALLTGFVCAFCMIVLTIADCFDFFSRVGLCVERFNLDFLSIAIGNGVVILLFIVAYVLIDSHNIAKEKNKRRIALGILQNIYEQCAHVIDLFEDEDARQSAAAKCENKKVISQDPMRMHYRNLPFAENNDIVIDFAKDGILKHEELKTYFAIRKKFYRYIDWLLIFPDEKSYRSRKSERTELLMCLESALLKIQEGILHDNK